MKNILNTIKQDDPQFSRGSSYDGHAQSKIAVDQRISNLKELVFKHPAITVLKEFEQQLLKKPLNRNQLRVLLSSEGAFVLEVPPGILFLSCRITDHRYKTNPFDATGYAARILYAAVDEYGLNNMSIGLQPSHHQLYADMCKHFGIGEDELLNPQFIAVAARKMAEVINYNYRKAPLATAIGFHVANETTAPLDFGVFLRYFKQYISAHSLNENNGQILGFLHVHEDVEESHREAGLEMVQIFIDDSAPSEKEQIFKAVTEGINIYMNAYKEMFEEINKLLF